MGTGDTLQNLPTGSGIYRLRHALTDDSYIGQAVCIIGRVGQHIAGIVGNTHHSDKVSRCFSGGEIQHLVVDVLDLCSVDDLNEHEREMIALHKPTLNGNGGASGGGRAGARAPIELIIDDEYLTKRLRSWAQEEERELGVHIARVLQQAHDAWFNRTYVAQPANPVVTELQAIRALLEKQSK